MDGDVRMISFVCKEWRNAGGSTRRTSLRPMPSARRFASLTTHAFGTEIRFAYDPCLRHGDSLRLRPMPSAWRFASLTPFLQHWVSACRGLRPRTPGCIPTSDLASLNPNNNHLYYT